MKHSRENNMKSMTKPCYQSCISKKYLLPAQLFETATKIIAEKASQQKLGRPKIDSKKALSGIYYLLKTGVQWNALPRCFGSSSAVHRYFQYLVLLNFFDTIWKVEVKNYSDTHGLDMKNQSGDCAHTKAPLGGAATGKSPVDRKKLGTKRSVIVEGNGVPIGLAVGPAQLHDSKLLPATLASIDHAIERPRLQKMQLDAAYDDNEVRIALFNYNYVPRIAPNQRRSKKTKYYAYSEELNTRWVSERTHSWSNRFRHILVRWDKKLANYEAMLHFAFASIIFAKL